MAKQTDRYFIDINKTHHRLICHRNYRDICTCINKMAQIINLIKKIKFDKDTILLGGVNTCSPGRLQQSLVLVGM